MKTRISLLLALTVLSVNNSLRAQGTAFTYQGQLNSGGGAANGLYDFQFSLSNAPTGGGQVGGTLTKLAVGVTNGLFSAPLDFGAVFTGNNTWLAISVRSNGTGSYTGLAPLQPLTPAPYAIFANTASNLSGAVLAANLPDGLGGNNNTATGTYATVSGGHNNTASGTDATVGGGGAAFVANSGNTASGIFATVSGGGYNTASGYGATVSGGGEFQGGNSAGGDFSTVPGGLKNVASGQYSFAAGQQAQATNQGAFVWADSQNAPFTSTNNDSFNVRAEGGFRLVTSGAGMVVDGQAVFTGINGGGLTNLSAAQLNGAVLAANLPDGLGGNNNTATGTYATVSGGHNNTASGTDATVGGGGAAFVANSGNTASGIFATVSGGGYNTASGYGATVSGGGEFQGGNLAGGDFSTVPDGLKNVASGQYSFAAGQQAQATNQGAFVWADSQNAPFTSTNNDSFNVRAAGGVRLVTGGAGMVVDGEAVFTGVNGGGLTNLNAAQLSGAVLAANLPGGLGGNNNTASGTYATVSGGHNNTASGIDATVGGGGAAFVANSGNTASGTFSTVSGGGYNTAGGYGATVGGGGEYQGGNLASGDFSTVPGGLKNVAGGQYSFAAGQQAQATNQGAFVWADSQSGTFSSTTNDQFLVRARGGVGINTASTVESDLCINTNTYLFSHAVYLRGDTGVDHNHGLAYCGPGETNFAAAVLPDGPVLWGYGGGALGVVSNGSKPVLVWSSSGVTVNGIAVSSDRNVKSGFAALNPQEILARVAALPVTSWVYTNDVSARHVGPMAQDFHAAFALNGSDDKHISVIDEGGVALAAIQGLNQKLESQAKEKDTEIQELKQSVAELKKMVQALAEKK